MRDWEEIMWPDALIRNYTDDMLSAYVPYPDGLDREEWIEQAEQLDTRAAKQLQEDFNVQR